MAKKQTFDELMKDKFPESIYTPNAVIQSIPTGSFSLDICTGVGGIPLGKFTEIYGPESTGKTTLLLSAAKNTARTLYVDVEQSLTYDYAKNILGDLNENLIQIVKPQFAEDAFEIMEAGIESGEFSMIVLDSIGALNPKKESDDDFTDVNVALVPRLMRKFITRNSFDIIRNNIAVVLVNQVRADIGSYVKSYSTPGGYAIKHMASLIISLTKGTQIKLADTVVGINTVFTIKKNKLAKPFGNGTIPIIFGKGVDTMRDLLNFAEDLGIIERRGTIYVFEGETLGRGTVASMNYLSENKETLDKIVKVCYNMLNAVKGADDGENAIG